MSITELHVEAFDYLTQYHFPEHGHNANLPHHLLGLQSNAPDVPCNLHCDGITLKHSDDIPLRFSFEPDPWASHILIELRLFPVKGKPSAADVARGIKEKVRVAFSTYDESSNLSENAHRTRYRYVHNQNNTPLSGPINFSNQIHELRASPGTGSTVPKTALHDVSKYKPEDQLHFSWMAKSCTKFSFGLEKMESLSADKKRAIQTLIAILTKMLQGGHTLHVVTRPSTIIKGIFFPWFTAMPSPVLPSYFPWLQKLNSADLKAIVQIDSRGDPTIYPAYVQRALAQREKGWIKQALQGTLDLAILPTNFTMGHLSQVTQFRDAREYLAHVLVGYLLEDAYSRRQIGTYADGTHGCQICPEAAVDGLPRYIVLINVSMPPTSEGARSQQDRGVPQVGERVTIQLTVNNMQQTWTGQVEPMRAALSQQYAANVLIVASPDPLTPITGRITSNGEHEATFSFGHQGTSTAPTIDRITSLMLGVEKKDSFWRNVLLAQDNYSMAPQASCSPSLGENWKDQVIRVCKLRRLNQAQTEVVKHYFTHRLTIVRGPPGTGKSTLVDTIVQLEHLFGTNLWVSADSNAAVDVLAEKACKRTGQLHPAGYLRIRQTFREVLRLHADLATRTATIKTLELPTDTAESPDAVRQQINDVFNQAGLGEQAMSLENMVKVMMDRTNGQPLYQEAKQDLQKLKATMDLFALLQYEPANALQYDLDKQKLEKQMISQLRTVQQSFVPVTRVVFSTVTAASSTLLRKMKPRALIMDNASQTIEAKAVSAIMHAHRAGRLERVLLIGDDQQLPPTVVSDTNPFTPTMGTSLFERLISSGFECSTLSEQFRMHPDISSIVNKTIYAKLPGFGGLKDAPSTDQVSQRFQDLVQTLYKVAKVQTRSVQHALVISPVDDPARPGAWKCRQLKGSFSRFNLITARTVLHLIYQATVRHKYHPRDIMVICFYADQVRLLKCVVEQIDHRLIPDLNKLRIMTVDGSQGLEAELVIVDCVVLGAANGDGMGFLGQDPRRFNVAMSRAQKGRIVIAQANMVPPGQATKTWTGFLEEAKDRRAILDGAIFNSSIPDGAISTTINAVFASWMTKSDAKTKYKLAHKNHRTKDTVEASKLVFLKADITRFMEVTSCSESLAQRYLNAAKHNMVQAIQAYFTDFPSEEGEVE